MKLNLQYSIFLLFLMASFVSLQDRSIPKSPCTSVFNYYISETYEIFGVTTFKNDLSGEYTLDVTMTINMRTDKSLRIVRITSENEIQNGHDIKYYVNFPFNHTFPLVTSIVFNGKLFCSDGDSIIDRTGNGITTLRKSDAIITTINKDLLKTTTTTEKSTSQSTDVEDRTPLVDECGIAVDTKPLVFHGKPTKSGEYPWLVAMFYLGANAEYKFRCAGTLISKTHVITAAHCVERTQINKEDVVLVLGKHNIKTWAIQSTIRDVKTIYIHPSYRQPGDADIAILETSSPVEFTGTIKPVCMWSGGNSLDDVVGKVGTVVGWGRDEDNNEFVFEPRQLAMPIVSQETCLRSDDRFIRITSNRSFCAGSRNGSIPCTGDSGGGFIIKQKGRFHLRGVVSVALVDSLTSTCDGSHYAVFTDIPKFSDWLNDILSRKT